MTDERLRRFARLLTTMDQGQDEIQRRARQRAARAIAADLIRERDVLVDKLTRGDRWLTRHPDAPDHDERETTWLGWLRDYEAVCDALRASPWHV
jgi:hypothetical protein